MVECPKCMWIQVYQVIKNHRKRKVCFQCKYKFEVSPSRVLRRYTNRQAAEAQVQQFNATIQSFISELHPVSQPNEEVLSHELLAGTRRLIDVFDFLILSQCQTPKTSKELVSLLPREQSVLYDRIVDLESRKLLTNINSAYPKLLQVNSSSNIIPLVQFKLKIQDCPLNFAKKCANDPRLVFRRCMKNWQYWEGDFEIPGSNVAHITIYPNIFRIHLAMPIERVPHTSWKKSLQFLMQHLKQTIKFLYTVFPGLKLTSKKQFLADTIADLYSTSYYTNAPRTKDVQEWLIGHARSQTWIFLQRTTFKAAWEVAEQLMRTFDWKQVPFIIQCNDLGHPIDIARWDNVQLVRRIKKLGVNGKPLAFDNPEDEFWRRFTLGPKEYLSFVPDIGDSDT